MGYSPWGHKESDFFEQLGTHWKSGTPPHDPTLLRGPDTQAQAGGVVCFFFFFPNYALLGWDV